MSFKDITELLDPDLEIALQGHRYMVSPPTRDAGLKLAAIVAVGVQVYSAGRDVCPTCGRSGNPELPQETKDLFESMRDTDLAQLSLGSEVVAAMERDGVPERHQDKAAQYAMYYWVLGGDVADAIMNPKNQAEQAAQQDTPKA